MYDYDSLWKYDVSDDIISGNTSNLQRELDQGWNINEPIAKYYFQGIMKFPIMLAIQKNNMSSVKYLLDQDAYLDIENEHAFLCALKFSNEEMIRYVVSKGASVNEGKASAYNIIFGRNKLEYIHILEDLNIPVNPYAEKVFFTAVYHNNYELIGELINHEVDINYCKKTDWNALGNTPLCEAACYCDEKMIQYLINHGANPNVPNSTGKRPYKLALIQGNTKNVKLLEKYEPSKPDEKVVSLLPQDLLAFLKKGDLKLYPQKIDEVQYIDFFPITEFTLDNFDGREGIRITREIDFFPTICLLWNFKKKCISYYEEENGWYGDFGVSFQTFIKQPEIYIDGIFTEKFVE